MQPAPFSQRLATYIGPDHAAPVKHVFTMLSQLVATRNKSVERILDVGCASGDLLAYLGALHPVASLDGVDLSEPLIKLAKQRPELARAMLVCGDGVEYRGERADLVTCFGMLGIFDTFETILSALLANRAPGGMVVVHALCNPDDIDVLVTYRDNAYSENWQRGFNIFSQARILDWLTKQGLSGRFHDVELPLDLAKRPHQPHRAHTLQLADGRRRTINGLCQILPETLLVITDRKQESP